MGPGAGQLRLWLALAMLAAGCGHRQSSAQSSGQYVRLGLPALPPPGLAVSASSDPFAAFLLYAQDHATPSPGKLRESAMIDQASIAAIPRRSNCREQKPAVLLDLDPGNDSFDLADPPTPAPGLAAGLATLRISGIRILWTASLPQGAEPQLRTVLRATTLDPDDSDLLLLPGGVTARKQAVRQAAARDWCILAIAGDRRADFDEVFDFLRDPDGLTAQALESNLGAGWFLTPLPIS